MSSVFVSQAAFTPLRPAAVQINDARARQLFNGQLQVVMPMHAAGGGRGGAGGGKAAKRGRKNREGGQQGGEEEEEEAIEDDVEAAPAAQNAGAGGGGGGRRKRTLPDSVTGAGQPGGGRKLKGQGGPQANVKAAFARVGAHPLGGAGAAAAIPMYTGAAGSAPIDLTGMSDDEDEVEDSAVPAAAAGGRRSGAGNRGRLTPEEVAAARQRRKSGGAAANNHPPTSGAMPGAEGAGGSGGGGYNNHNNWQLGQGDGGTGMSGGDGSGGHAQGRGGTRHYDSNSLEYSAVTCGLDELRSWLAELKGSKPQFIFGPMVSGWVLHPPCVNSTGGVWQLPSFSMTILLSTHYGSKIL